MPGEVGDAAEFLADVRALEAAGAEMIGLDGDATEQRVMLGAIAAVTHRVKLRLPNRELEDVLHRLGRGRSVVGDPEGETWVSVGMPADRDSWAAMGRDQQAPGVPGVCGPGDPRPRGGVRDP